MSADIRRELDRLSMEVKKMKKSLYSMAEKTSPEVKLKRYHALLNRISRTPAVNVTPDELISSLKQKEY